jgi:L-ascorbate metabolism protein UlaG (beta-lactamase superfamily)
MVAVNARAVLLLAIVSGAIHCSAQELTGFRSIQRLTNHEVQLRLNSTSSYRIHVSTNLNAWEPLVTAARQSTQYLDSGAPYRTNRFYSVNEVTGTNVLTGDHIVTSDGEVIVRPVNHASFVMRWKETMIYNDPVGANSLYSAFAKADLILVSHTHSDHFSPSTLAFVRGTNGVIIAPQAVYNGLSATLRAATIVLTNGASTNVNGIHIEAVPAYNGNHARGTGNGYVVTIGGKRFYMAGDTGDVPEMRALQNIDVAFLCMNVPFTMNVAAAASAARDFRPRILYPYHYRNQDGTFANITELKRQIGTEHGIEVRTRTWY